MVNPSGLFPDAQAIGNVVIGVSSSNSPVYLRDLVDISRGYQSPPTYLNFLNWQDENGKWIRSRAVTLAIYMRDGQQIDLFGKHVTEKLDAVKQYLPDDLIMVHTSDQPVQVKEQIDLFMDALVRGDRAGGDRLADRVLGVAISAADGAVDSGDAVADVRDDLPAGDRYSAGVGGVADHRAGAAGGRSGGGGRFDQANAGRGTAAHRRAVAGTDEDCDCDPVRDDYQHRGLSAVHAA